MGAQRSESGILEYGVLGGRVGPCGGLVPSRLWRIFYEAKSRPKHSTFRLRFRGQVGTGTRRVMPEERHAIGNVHSKYTYVHAPESREHTYATGACALEHTLA